ncbi:MAG TPA: nitrogenase [Cyanobacteria bacterium UBA8553]|nr:nitrogenase [Cyanobacteria bacterium UBA8553]
MTKLTYSSIENPTLTSWVWIAPAKSTAKKNQQGYSSLKRFDLLQPLRQMLDKVDVRDRELAHRLCQMIPTQCPFEREVKLFGRTLFRIPPLCKLNPLYDEVVALRFRALCYLADECGEDVSCYC